MATSQEHCLFHLQEYMYTALQCSCGAVSGCEIPTHAEHTFSVCLGSWSMNQVHGKRRQWRILIHRTRPKFDCWHLTSTGAAKFCDVSWHRVCGSATETCCCWPGVVPNFFFRNLEHGRQLKCETKTTTDLSHFRFVFVFAPIVVFVLVSVNEIDLFSFCARRGL